MAKKFNPIVPVVDDGLKTPEVGPWSDLKYNLLGHYGNIFNSGMKNIMQTRIYVDLFAGAGYARIKGTKNVRYSSALIAMSLPDSFSRFIFSEEDPEKMDALVTRVKRHFPEKEHLVTYFTGDTNANIGKIKARIPPSYPENKVLTFAFVDPFSMNLEFNTIKALADGRVDFLILLALQMDAKRNMERYLKEESSKIALYLNDQNWRSKFLKTGFSHSDFTRFLSDNYDLNMESIGYLKPTEKHRISTLDTRLPLYYLAFYSKHERGNEFWDKIRKYSNGQLEVF